MIISLEELYKCHTFTFLPEPNGIRKLKKYQILAGAELTVSTFMKRWMVRMLMSCQRTEEDFKVSTVVCHICDGVDADVPRPVDPAAPSKLALLLASRPASTLWPQRSVTLPATRGHVPSPTAVDTNTLTCGLLWCRSTSSRGRSVGRRRQRQHLIDELKQAYSRGFTALLTSANVSAKTYTVSGILRWYSDQMWIRWTVKYGVQHVMNESTMQSVIWTVRTRARDIAATLNATRRSRGDVTDDLLDLFPVPVENSSASFDDMSAAHLLPVAVQ